MIKTKFIYGLATVALVTTFTACNKDEHKKEEPQTQQEVIKDLSVETQAVALIIGENSEVTISDGNGTYTITSADESIAVASISDNKIKIEAKKDGETFLTLKDAKGKEQRISVKIFKTLGVAENQVTLKIRSEKQIDIAGNGEFEASVDNTNATAEIQGDRVKITAASLGASVVTIKDKKSGKTITINVTIEDYPAVVATENEVEIFIGATTEIGVSGGTENFVVSVNNAHATAVIENGKVKITGVSAGTSEVKIKDETAGKEKKIKVIVKYNNLNLTTSTTSLSVYGKLITNSGQTEEGEKKTFTISGGSGNYQVQASSDVILVTKKSNTEWEVQGNTQNNNRSTATITITDLSTNQTAIIEVQVTRAFQIYDTSLQINAEETKTISYYGTKPTSIIVQNPDFVEVSISDISDASGKKTISLKGKTEGTTNVTFSDGVKSYTLRVIVKPKLEFSLLNLRNQRLTIASGQDEVELKVKGSGDFSVTLSQNKVDYDISTEKDDSCNCYPITFTRNENDDTGNISVTVKDNVLNQSKNFTLIVKTY